MKFNKRDNPTTIYKDDLIRVTNPMVIDYVGYENHITKVVEEVKQAFALVPGEKNKHIHYGNLHYGNLNKWDWDYPDGWGTNIYLDMFKSIEDRIDDKLSMPLRSYRRKIFDRIVHSIAYEIVGARMSKAKNQIRKKFEIEEKKLLGLTRQVVRTQMHKTGKREVDEEYTYLSEGKTFKSVWISRRGDGWTPSFPHTIKGKRLQEEDQYQFDIANVEKVIPFSEMLHVTEWLEEFYPLMTIGQKCDAFVHVALRRRASDKAIDFIVAQNNLKEIREYYPQRNYYQGEEELFDQFFKALDTDVENELTQKSW